MSWFLSKKTKTRTRRSATPTRKPPKSEPWDPAKTLRMISAAGWVVLIASLLGGWAIGQRSLRYHVASHRQARPVVVLHNLPDWMHPQIMQQIQQEIESHIEPGPFDQLSLQEAAVELANNPWVKQVRRVHRQPGGRIDVHATYRVPAALIETREGYHLVDDHGVRLPLVYNAARAAQVEMPVIRGVKQPTPLPGDGWEGADMRAGLRLAQLVAEQPWAEQVKAIDVRNYGGRVDRAMPHLLIETRAGLVRWGRAPGEEQFYEPPAVDKLDQLQVVLRKFKTIDAGGQVVDVYTDTPLIHPAAETAAFRYSGRS